MDIRNLHRGGRWNTPFLPCWKPEDGPHPRKRPRALCFEALLALMMLLMLACTAVQDPSERWKTSGMDPGLEGKWMDKEKDQFVFGGPDDDAPPPRKPPEYVFAKHKDGYYLWQDVNNPKGEPTVFRTFSAGKKNFMLIVKPIAIEKKFDKALKEEDRSGMIWAYEVQDDVLHLSILNPERLNQAILAGKIKGTRAKAGTEDEAKIATLDDATCAALAEVTDDEKTVDKDKKTWIEFAQFKRVKEDPKASGKPVAK